MSNNADCDVNTTSVVNLQLIEFSVSLQRKLNTEHVQ